MHKIPCSTCPWVAAGVCFSLNTEQLLGCRRHTVVHQYLRSQISPGPSCFQKGPDGDFCCCTWSLRLLCLAPLNQDLFITAGVKNSACCWSVLIPTPGAHLPRISPNPCAAFHWHLEFFFSAFYLFFSTAFISVITDCYILSIDLSVQIPFQITI